MKQLLLVLLAPFLLGGCPMCDWDYDLAVVRGAEPLAPGQGLAMWLDSEGDTFGPRDCGGFWYVDDIEGGNETVGTITTCGIYTAPAVAPAKTVLVTAYGDGKDCADCCSYGEHTVKLQVLDATANFK